MEVFEAIQKRKSVRKYAATPVPRDILEKVLEAARLAPSAGNIQPWHFIVVTDAAKRKILSRGRYAKFLKESPVVVVLCGKVKSSPNWYAVDVALAGENLVLAATAEGLGTCWVGSFDERSVKDLLGVPGDLRVVALLAVGYAVGDAGLGQRLFHLVRRRKRLEEVVSWEVYGERVAAGRGDLG